MPLQVTRHFFYPPSFLSYPMDAALKGHSLKCHVFPALVIKPGCVRGFRLCHAGYCPLVITRSALPCRGRTTSMPPPPQPCTGPAPPTDALPVHAQFLAPFKLFPPVNLKGPQIVRPRRASLKDPWPGGSRHSGSPEGRIVISPH